MERIDLSSLPFLPPASKFIFDCQKKKKRKKEKSGCFSWMLCTLLSGLSDFQLDPRGRNQGFYNVVCQRVFLFCKRPGLDHMLFHDFKIGHLREILIYGLP